MADDRDFDELSTEELDAVAGGLEAEPNNGCTVTNASACNSAAGCGVKGT